MRVKVIGENTAAKALRGHLSAFSSAAVVEERPDFTLQLEVLPTGSTTTVDGVHGLLEAHVINRLAQDLGAVLIRRSGSSTRDDFIIVHLPQDCEMSGERALFRALTDGVVKPDRSEPAKELEKPLAPERRSWITRLWPSMFLLCVVQAEAQNVFQIKCNNGTTSFWCADATNTALRVYLVASDVATGGTSSTFGAAFPATGTAAGYSDGTNMQGARVFDLDSGGGTQYGLGVNLRFAGAGGSTEAAADTGNNAFRVNCVTGCAGSSFADAGAFTFGTTTVSNTAFVVDDTATNTVAENSAGAARMNTNRILYSMNTNSSGTEVGTAGSPFRVDPTGTTTQPVSITAGNFPDNEPFNVAQINGVTPLMGNGVTGTGSQRVTIASDNTAFTVNVGTFPDNEPINLAQMNGVAVTMNNGAAGTGVQRVTLASDSTGNIATIGTSVTPGTGAANLGKAEDAGHTTADTGVAVWGVRNDPDGTPTETSSTDLDYQTVSVDSFGTMSGALYMPWQWSYHEDSSSALTDTTVHASCGTGLFNYIDTLVFSTGAATAASIKIEDSTTTTILGPYYLEAVNGRGMAINYFPGKKQTNSATLISVTTTGAIAHSIDIIGHCGR